MLPNYLASIKSSGIYRFVWDKSEMPAAPARILRLVVGYSEKGPFNTPVYVTSDTEFKQIFGGISKKMERYGVWFHRLAIQALKAGPILCLNLKNFEDGKDNENKVEFTTFNPSESIFNMDEVSQKIQENLKMTVKDLYNTDRFWKLEPEHLEDLEIDGIVPTGKKQGYITITTTDSKDTSVTVFMRGYEPTGYDVPFREWYSAVLNGEEVPTYLEGHENDLVSQYFAQLFVFRGKFTPEIAASDKLAKFFNVDGDQVTLKPYIENAFGEKVDTLTALAANDASNFIRSYTGILIPDFRDTNNVVISLDAQVNADNYLHKLMMRLNQDMLYNIDPDDEESFQISDIDTTGWYKGPKVSNVPMMSLTTIDPVIYTANFGGDEQWHYSTDDTHNGLAADYYKYVDLTCTQGEDERTLVFDDPHEKFGKSGIHEGDTLYMEVEDNPDTETDDESEATTLVHVVKITSEVPTPATHHKYVVKGDGQVIDAKYDEDPTSDIQQLYRVVTGDQTIVEGLTTDPASEITHTDTVPEHWTYDGQDYSTEVTAVYDEANQTWSVMCDGEAIAESLTNDPTSNITHTDTVPQYWTYNGQNYSTEVISKSYYVYGEQEYDEVTVETTATPTYTVLFDKEVSADSTIYKCVGSVTFTSANLAPLYLEGYTFANPKPASTQQWDKLQWQHHILDTLTNYRGIRLALTNRVDVDYRYLVDTFESFVENELKSKLTNIVMTKDNTFGIINWPSMKSFSKCKYVSFRDDNQEFITKYIPMGGNPLKPQSLVFSLPSQENGASWAGYFSALALKDPNTAQRIEIPSAALVSNDFMNKFTKYFPYTIIAGPNRAVIREPGLLGPDFNFSREDLDELEPFGVNCMVYEPRKGTFINSNQTAKQNPVTALSKIHVRELCIYLQDEIEKLLTDYHWDFNTPNLQNRVKDRADVILGQVQHNDGIHDFKNVCDESNNTDDVVNAEMFVISTSIEPAQGAGKMVQNLTIYRKGGMSAEYIEY